jgi:hypothetical protein
MSDFAISDIRADAERVWLTLMSHLCPRHRINARNGRSTDWDIEELRSENYGAYTDAGYFRKIVEELARRHTEIEIERNVIRLTEQGLHNCSRYDRTFQRDF